MRVEQAKVLAKTFKVSVRTIQSWEAKGAPLGDLSKMDAWIAEQRRRRGVSKHAKKVTEDVTIINAEPVEPIVVANVEQTTAALDSTLARLETAERIAYARYQETGSRLEGVFWMGITEQLRRERLAAGEVQEVNDADWQIVNACFEIISELIMHLSNESGFPRLVTLLCEGYDDIPDWQVKKAGVPKWQLQRQIVSKKVLGQVENILANAFHNLGALVKGTKLEPCFNHRVREKANEFSVEEES